VFAFSAAAFSSFSNEVRIGSARKRLNPISIKEEVIMKILVCVLGFFFFIMGSSQAVDWYVPDNFPAIQDAINAASDGDTITVRAGTYDEMIDFLGKAIHLKSESGAEATVIGGNQPESVVSFITGEGPDSILDGFTVTGGRGTFVQYHQYLVSGYVGGGIYCWSSSPTITNNIITDNHVGAG